MTFFPITDAPQWGAQYLGHGQTRFSLWAPDVKELFLLLAGSAPSPMQRVKDGWFELIAKAAPGHAYKFSHADSFWPDPASRLQKGGAEGWSVIVENTKVKGAQSWCGRPWRETVIYELHVGTCGGFNRVKERLYALADIGITAIELMPIAATPGEHNWGYDGVFPFAVRESLGTPEELHSLINLAHQLGLQVFLDVVYNHFGPAGNFLAEYASPFFVADSHTPWGQAIDFQKPEVSQFWLENALYWLNTFRFDGLRFDAVHAINDNEWLTGLGKSIRERLEPDRFVHLMLENEQNSAHLLRGENILDSERRPFNAQWNDDIHNALHVLLTDESEGYYKAFANTPDGRTPVEHLARCLTEGFAWQGEPWPLDDEDTSESRGTTTTGLLPSSFIFFLQNHDQIGNRAMGDRLVTTVSFEKLAAARTLQLLCPQIPLLFMGEEWGCKQPFIFFTDFEGELADAVREGRRKEFANFTGFADFSAQAAIPDPNAESSFIKSCISWDEQATPEAVKWTQVTRELLRLRRTRILPLVSMPCTSEASVIARKAITVKWNFENGVILTCFINLGGDSVFVERADLRDFVPGVKSHSEDLLFECKDGSARQLLNGMLPADSCIFYMREKPG